MNILPKKRWHVRTKANIARVRKDEALAAEEDRKKLLRSQIAEQEAKKEALRKKAREKYNKNNLLSASNASELDQNNVITNNHVNLFYELEKNEVVSNKPNEEHEKEEKLEREKYEKQIGYLTYLGQDTNELTGNVSWYNKARKEIYNAKEEISKKQKIFEDPLTEINKYIKHDEFKKPSATNNCESKSNYEKYFIDHEKLEQSTNKKKHKKVKKKKHKEVKKEKHKKKKKRQEKNNIHYDSNQEVVDKKNSNIDIERLRAERIKREKEERRRAEEVIARLNGTEIKKEPSPTLVQRYHSQYNPHLAKQNYV